MFLYTTYVLYDDLMSFMFSVLFVLTQLIEYLVETKLFYIYFNLYTTINKNKIDKLSSNHVWY